MRPRYVNVCFSSFFCPNHVKTHEEDRHNVIVIGLKHVSHLHVSHCFQDHSSKSGWTRSARAKKRSMCFSPRRVEDVEGIGKV